MPKPRSKKEPLSGQSPSPPPTANARKLVTYAEARKILATKFRASDAEIARWVMVEQSPHLTDTTQGQLNAYTKQGEWFHWNPALHHSHNTSQLARLFFDVAELNNFDPARGYGRWLSYEAIVDRWTSYGFRREWIEELIADLTDDAQQRELTRFAHPRQAMYRESQVEEAERALGLAAASSNSRQALRQQGLEGLLTEAKVRDKTFDRGEMPGTKKEFLRFLSAYARHYNNAALKELANRGASTLQKTLHACKAGFLPGAPGSEDTYWRSLFPEISQD